MGLASVLASAPGVYFGTGDGIESGPFVARIAISVLPNGGVAIDYEATSREHGLQHAEHSLLVAGPDRHEHLYVAHSESPFLTEFVAATELGRFELVEVDGPYDTAVVIDVPEPGRLVYAWWWAARGEPLIEQSKARVAVQAPLAG